MTIQGILTKITATKKLMIKIDKPTYEMMTRRMKMLATKLGHTDSHLATWNYTNDYGETHYCLSVKLDRYDVQNLRKFEALVKSQVVITGTFAPYAFPEGEKQHCCGINYVLQNIRKRRVTLDTIDTLVAEQLNPDTTLTPDERAIDAHVTARVQQILSLGSGQS